MNEIGSFGELIDVALKGGGLGDACVDVKSWGSNTSVLFDLSRGANRVVLGNGEWGLGRELRRGEESHKERWLFKVHGWMLGIGS